MTERDLEDFLEFVQEGTGSGLGQGTGVQFQTPIRPSSDTYMDSSNPIQLGGGTMEVDPRSNQDLNPSGQDATSDPTQLSEEIKVLRKLLHELRDKVFGAGGSGYTFKGRPICSQLDVEALLEKELPRKYVPVSCFICPYILLDFVYQYLYDELSLTVSNRTKCDDCGLEIFDFWAGEAKQKIVLSLLSSTKVIQGVNYKHSPSLKFKLPFFAVIRGFW